MLPDKIQQNNNLPRRLEQDETVPNSM